MFLYLSGCRICEVITGERRRRSTGSEAKYFEDSFYSGERAGVWSLSTLKRKVGLVRNVALPLDSEIDPWVKVVAEEWGGGNPWGLSYQEAYKANLEVFKGYGYIIEPQRVELTDPLLIEKYAVEFSRRGNVEKATKLRETGIFFESGKHPKRASDHVFRHIRTRELTQSYGFTDNDLMTFFGWSPVSFGKNPYMQRYQNLRWQDYFPKLLRKRVG